MWKYERESAQDFVSVVWKGMNIKAKNETWETGQRLDKTVWGDESHKLPSEENLKIRRGGVYFHCDCIKVSNAVNEKYIKSWSVRDKKEKFLFIFFQEEFCDGTKQ